MRAADGQAHHGALRQQPARWLETPPTPLPEDGAASASWTVRRLRPLPRTSPERRPLILEARRGLMSPPWPQKMRMTCLRSPGRRLRSLEARGGPGSPPPDVEHLPPLPTPGLPAEFFDKAAEDLPNVDLLIVAGTSLVVAPANSVVYQVGAEGEALAPLSGSRPGSHGGPGRCLAPGGRPNGGPSSRTSRAPVFNLRWTPSARGSWSTGSPSATSWACATASRARATSSARASATWSSSS